MIFAWMCGCVPTFKGLQVTARLLCSLSTVVLGRSQFLYVRAKILIPSSICIFLLPIDHYQHRIRSVIHVVHDDCKDIYELNLVELVR